MLKILHVDWNKHQHLTRHIPLEEILLAEATHSGIVEKRHAGDLDEAGTQEGDIHVAGLEWSETADHVR